MMRFFLAWPKNEQQREGFELLVIGLEEYFKGRMETRSGVEIVTEDERVEAALRALFEEINDAEKDAPGKSVNSILPSATPTVEDMVQASGMGRETFVEDLSKALEHYPYTCKICSQTFTGKGYGLDGQYCSKKCQKKASNQRYTAKQKAAAQAVKDELEEELRQVLQFRIESSGKEISDPTSLLRTKRLAVGEKLHKKDGRVYKVVQRGDALKLVREV